MLIRILKFMGSNYTYVIWFILYFSIALAMIGDTQQNFFLLLLVYGVSIGIALSPIGEAILRATENCREPSTEEEKNYLLPIFEEVYQDAITVNPNLNKEIKIYIKDAMYINAFAMGRKTIAVTKGGLTTWTRDELKGIIAHEFGHITHGHTKALLLSLIGNFFFSIIVWVLRLFLTIMQFICEVVAEFNWLGSIFAILTAIVQIIVDLSVFVFINLSEMILASNSRSNEFQADTFAYEVGYGKELISGLYLLQKTTIQNKLSIPERLKATHPHISQRIANLERLNQI